MKNLAAMVLLSLILGACSSPKSKNSTAETKKRQQQVSSQTDEGQRIKFKKDLVIGDDNTEPIFSFITAFDVDSTGNIYCGDWKKRTIFKFDGEGKLLRKIGRKGKGPGEFRYLQGMQVLDEHIFALDGGLVRLSEFSTDGKLLKTTNLKKIENATKYASTPNKMEMVLKEGKPLFLLDYTISYSPGTSKTKRTQKYVSVNNQGKFVKNPVLEVPADERYVKDTGHSISVGPKPFARSAVVQTGPDNRIYYGWTDSLVIEVYSPAGQLEQTIRHPVAKRAVSEADLQAAKKDHPKEFQNMHLADTWPAFENFVIDKQNRIWVETRTSDRSKNRWLLLNEKAKMLGSVVLPGNVNIEKIQDGYAYATSYDQKQGPLLIRYQIDMQL